MNPTIRTDIAWIAGQRVHWELLSGASILITGASGILPSYMVETLLYLNDFLLESPVHVYALVRDEPRARVRFADYLGRSDLNLLVQDVCDPVSLPVRPDFVIHGASHVRPGAQRSDPAGTLSANVIGTYNLLRLAQGLPLKGFLYFSSGNVYGRLDQPLRYLSESDSGVLGIGDISASYAHGKRMGEMMCVAWEKQYGVPVRIVRPFHTYGPGMRLNDGRLCADFVRDILSGRHPVFNGDGSSRFCFCYLADATAAFFTVLLEGTNGEVYNVANPGAACTIAQLAERLAAANGLPTSHVRRGSSEEGSGSDRPGPLPSIRKIQALGWTPSIGIEDGFARTVASYRDINS